MNCLNCFKPKPKQVETERRIRANDHAFNETFQYANNYIKTSKYNVATFLPKNLFEQFQRLANFYFLMLMILQLIPQISSLTPTTTIIPLFCVLAMTAVKDAFDDIQRHRSDNEVNNRKSFVVRGGKEVEERWQRVKVGDVIRMENGHFVAADLLLLSTSEPHGLCYIETAELDGETNLKARQALEETAVMQDDIRQIGAFDADITCEAPNNRLSAFDGQMTWKGKTYALDNDKLLLRGCVIRNTKWCYGVVIFAGRDTKLMQNCGKTKFKRTSLDRFLNVLIIGIVIFLLSMCFICTVLCGLWEQSTGVHFQRYLPWSSEVEKVEEGTGNKVAFIAFLVFFSYMILLNTVVPISLYVSVEIIRFMHSYWINWDTRMYYAPSDTPAKSRTTTLNEELGQIQYIFSDKTGTLTRNIMTFNKCSINGKAYGDVFDAGGQVILPDETTTMVDFSANKWHEPKFAWYDSTLLKDVQANVPEVDVFFRLLGVCHTIMADYSGESLMYQAQSPDEAALASAARNFGYVFLSRTPASIDIEVKGKTESFELLAILDFNNVRKRMSVLVKNKTEQKILLLCKGADTMILQRLGPKSSVDLQKQTQAHLDKFANEGLRTLCLAYKEIDPAYYAEWSKRQHEASIAIDNRQEKLDAVYEEIEKDLILLGATAIEDKLQEGVPEAIANLAAANIKIWVLTGDKQETAINIGYACRLLTDAMEEIFIVDGEELPDVHRQLQNILEQLRALNGQQTNENSYSNGDAAMTNAFLNSTTTNPASLKPVEGEPGGCALVINGHSLVHALEANLEQLFLEVGCACKAVICCRVTPLQKALVVDLVKRNKKAVTLAIGDGANDVSMIKTAHIGVGISGQEGMQAVLSSDFSIAQFRFLERLLLVHGRWSYLRMSKFLRYFFYKNFAFTLAHFWFAFFCGYSAQTIFDPVLIGCYNLFFTALPVLALGVLDQDVNDEFSLRYPKLYIPGQYNLYFNMRIFVYSVVHGIVSSLLLFFIPYGAGVNAALSNGQTVDDLHLFGFTIFTALVIAVTMQIGLDTAYWTGISHFTIWGSVAFYFLLVTVLYEAIPPGWGWGTEHGLIRKAFSSSYYWFTCIITTIVLMVPVIALRFFWFDTHPTLSDRVRVKQNLRRLQTKMSELPLRPLTASVRRRPSIRSGYAFAHHGGFGDLITKGIALREWRAATNAIVALGAISEEREESRGTQQSLASVSEQLSKVE